MDRVLERPSTSAGSEFSSLCAYDQLLTAFAFRYVKAAFSDFQCWCALGYYTGILTALYVSS